MKIDKTIVRIIKNNGIGILPTDTIYGIVGSVFSQKAIERIYKLKKRDPKKPMVIIISSIKDLGIFGIEIDKNLKKKLRKIWPAKISVILPCYSGKFFYLRRDSESLAIRMPDLKWLRKLLKKTGPLVATSVNFEAKEPAENINQAKKYFGNNVDFYVDAGKISAKPSTIIEIKNNDVIIKRRGQGEIKHF